jgi:hypothetical protein
MQTYGCYNAAFGTVLQAYNLEQYWRRFHYAAVLPMKRANGQDRIGSNFGLQGKGTARFADIAAGSPLNEVSSTAFESGDLYRKRERDARLAPSISGPESYFLFVFDIRHGQPRLLPRLKRPSSVPPCAIIPPFRAELSASAS